MQTEINSGFWKTAYTSLSCHDWHRLDRTNCTHCWNSLLQNRKRVPNSWWPRWGRPKESWVFVLAPSSAWNLHSNRPIAHGCMIVVWFYCTTPTDRVSNCWPALDRSSERIHPSRLKVSVKKSWVCQSDGKISSRCNIDTWRMSLRRRRMRIRASKIEVSVQIKKKKKIVFIILYYNK